MTVNVNRIPTASAVPPSDGIANNTFVDVVGNKNDTHGGNSAYSVAHSLEEHMVLTCDRR